MGALYAIREDITSTLEGNDTTRFNRQIDDALEASSRAVDKLTHREFTPFVGTKKFDYPNFDFTTSSELDLGGLYLSSVDSFDNGGTSLSASDYTLLNHSNSAVFPFTHIEIPNGLQQGSSFNGAWSISITGEWGWVDTKAAATLVSTVDADDTSIRLAPLNGRLDVGVGSTLRLEDEWVLVTDRTWVSMGTALSDVEANRGDNSIQVADATAYAIDEIIRVDGERMRVVDADTEQDLIYVERALFATVLSAHTTAPTIWAQRAFTVERGALGSTGAAHLAAVSVSVNRYPPLVKRLTVAETLNFLEQDSAAWARTVGSGDNVRNASGSALNEMRQKVYWSHGVTNRKAAI